MSNKRQNKRIRTETIGFAYTQKYVGLYFVFSFLIKITKIKLLKSGSTNYKNVALIEVDGSHDECLLTQICALKRTSVVLTLIVTQKILDRNRDFEALVDNLIVIDDSLTHNKIVRKILSSFRKHRIDLAVFNTAQGAKVRDISVKLFFSKIKLVGIIHTTKKFEDSFRQKVINLNIKNYFLLSEFLLSKVKPPKGISVDYFYPIRFPDFKTQRLKSSVTTISVIGGVENQKKDLAGFITMVESVKSFPVQFVFLGKSDPNRLEVQELKNKLDSINMADRVKLYDSFVSQEEFDRQLQQTDALLLLAHPSTSSVNQYYKTQISGAANVAFGYNIPLLMHSSFKDVGELKDRSIFYTLENFAEVVSDCKPKLLAIEEWMKNDKEMTNEVQENRYLSFLFN